MNVVEFERRLRSLALREGLTFATFATLNEADRAVLQTTILQRFDPQATWSERQVNEILKAWLASVGAMMETDHVHLRRWLIDTQVLARTADCAEYRVHPALAERSDIVRDAAVAALNAAAVVTETRRSACERRAARKAQWLEKVARTSEPDSGSRPGRPSAR